MRGPRTVHPADSVVIDVYRLHMQGWTYQAIGKKYGRGKTSIWRCINIYAPAIVNQNMNTNGQDNKSSDQAAQGAMSPSAGIIPGARSSGNERPTVSQEETLEQTACTFSQGFPHR